MNTSLTTLSPSPFSPLPARPENDDVDFRSLFGIISDARWLILTVTAATLLLGAAYILFTVPVYRADTLIQVEQAQNSSGDNVLSQLNSAFNVQSSASAEMEILRSRMIIGQTVDKLGVVISAAPNYLPIIGAWMARHATQLSKPGLFGYGGYVSGAESIKIEQLDVPPKLLGKALILTATANGYELEGPDNQKLANGTVGATAIFALGTGHILISSLKAEPGARFTLMRRTRINAIDNLQKQLAITEKNKPSGVLSVSLQGTNPTQVTLILNSIASAYAKQNTERKAAEAEKSLAFLDSSLPQLKHQMDESENEYTRFRDQHETFNLTTEGTLSLNTSAALQAQLFDLQQKRRALAAQFTSAYPGVRVIDQQISAATAQIAKLTAHIRSLPDLEQRLVNLTRNVKVNSDLYATLLNSAQQMRLIKEGKVGNVRIIDAAVVPRSPVKPDPLLALAISGTAGLLLGIVLALLRNWKHPSIKTVDDIEINLGMNVFATIPHSLPQAKMHQQLGNQASGNQVLALIAPDDPAIESLRSLRTTLQFLLRSTSNNIVLLTGPTPNIGKTFVAVNFAALLGAAGKRVLLIDADFRRGYLHQYFALGRRKGFSELINGDINITQATHENVMPNVDFISTGAATFNPAELLLSDKVGQILQRLSSQYDAVMIDTTPLLSVSDTMALAPLAGTVFLVARTQISTLGELEETAKRLHRAGAQVKGVIFNDITSANQRYGGKYGYYRAKGDEYPVIEN
ncbi:MAG: polysaccharide biosynthesis tyrosine autokinase [Burkholderiaceae bacterium]